MNLAAAQRCIPALAIIVMLDCIDRTRARVAYFFAGRRCAYSLPGTNDNAARRLSERDAATPVVSEISPSHGAE